MQPEVHITALDSRPRGCLKSPGKRLFPSAGGVPQAGWVLLHEFIFTEQPGSVHFIGFPERNEFRRSSVLANAAPVFCAVCPFASTLDRAQFIRPHTLP